MRLLTLSSLAVILNAKELYEVFGPRERNNMTEARSSLSPLRSKRDYNEYWSRRTPDNCTFGIDILLVQDVTLSFEDDLSQMIDEQLPIMINALSITHPGSRYAVLTHRDKPIWPLGIEGDYCARPGAPFNTDSSDLISAYQDFEATGGADGPESQFIALLAASQLSQYEWNSMHAHLIVVVSDAQPHFNLDGFNTMGLPEHPDLYDAADPDGQCVSVYYPSPDQVKASLHNINAYLGAVIYDPEYQYGLVARAWQWVIRDFGETDDFLNLMKSDSSDFWLKLSQVITELENAECIESSTAFPDTSLESTTVSEAAPTTSEQEPATALPTTVSDAVSTSEQEVTSPLLTTVSYATTITSEQDTTTALPTTVSNAVTLTSEQEPATAFPTTVSYAATITSEQEPASALPTTVSDAVSTSEQDLTSALSTTVSNAVTKSSEPELTTTSNTAITSSEPELTTTSNAGSISSEQEATASEWGSDTLAETTDPMPSTTLTFSSQCPPCTTRQCRRRSRNMRSTLSS